MKVRQFPDNFKILQTNFSGYSAYGQFGVYKFGLLIFLFINVGLMTNLFAHGAMDVPEEIQLAEALTKLSQKYEVFFSYDEKMVRDVEVTYEPDQYRNIEHALKELLTGTSLRFKIFDNRYIILYEQSQQAISSLKGMVRHLESVIDDQEEISQARKNGRPIEILKRNSLKHLQPLAFTVSGTVVDQNGETLIGVNIQVKGSNKGTATDIDGRFTLEDIDENAVLVISYIGFQTQEVAVAGKSSLNITMISDSQLLDEVVVVGYGTQKKVNLTGAIDVIGNEYLNERQSPTVSQLLQGQSSALDFSINNDGFQPGAEMGIKIRGMGSLSGGEPYVLIDGVPGNMNYLNPQDIQSISILKDAASASIYGARAAFGVILITTKNGMDNDKINITYSGNLIASYAQPLPEFLNSLTYAKAENEAGANEGGLVYTDEVMDRIRAYINEDWDYLKSFTIPNAKYLETVPLENGIWGEYREGHANNNWIEEYYGGPSFNNNHNLQISGSSNNINYFLSGGYLSQSGTINYGTDKYSRINFLGKLSTNLTDWWKLTYSSRVMNSDRERFNMGKEGDYSLAFHQILRAKPMMPKYDGNGYYVEKSMIPEINDSGTDRFLNTENWHSLKSTISLNENWNINLDYAIKFLNGSRTNTDLNAYSHLVDGTPSVIGITDPSGIRQYHNNETYWNNSIYTKYDFNIFNNHNFSLLVGNQIEHSSSKGINAQKNNLLLQQGAISLQTATGDPNVSESIFDWATIGYFGRLNYNYFGKYLFEFNIRRDGTSRFQSNKKWGTFPSLSVGWNIHHENFFTGISDIFDLLKIRGSWGALGNQNVEAYQDIALIPIRTSPLNWLWSYGGSRPIGYTGIPPIVSSLLTWENTVTKDIGFDVAAINNKLELSFDYFNRTTEKMLGPAEAKPGVLGSVSPQENNASLNTSGWEVSLKWSEWTKDKLSYSIQFNLYDSKTKIIDYYNPTGTLSTWYPGKVEGEIWGYTANDLFRNQQDLEYTDEVDLSFISGGIWRTGDVKYEDTNGDGKVDNGSNTIHDHGDLSVIGNSTPHFQYGILGNIYIGPIDFSMVMRGVFKRDIFFNSSQNMFWGFRSVGQSSIFKHQLDYFRDTPGTNNIGIYEGDKNINTDSYFPRPYNTSENNKNRHPSTLFMQSGAYLRVQNIQIGYTFATLNIYNLSLQDIRIYLAGENLFTFTKLPLGVDPVATSGAFGMGKTYGADRMITFGLNVSL